MTAQVIYFIKKASEVKIGITRDLKTRFRTISDLELQERHILIGAIYGDGFVERSTHALFSEHRLEGEWFELTPGVFGSILRLIETKGGQFGEAAFEMTERPLDRYERTEESVFTALAGRACEKLIAHFERETGTKMQGLRRASEFAGVRSGAIWNLCYRPTKTVTAGIYFAVTRAAAALDRAADQACGEDARPLSEAALSADPEIPARPAAGGEA